MPGCGDAEYIRVSKMYAVPVLKQDIRIKKTVKAGAQRLSKGQIILSPHNVHVPGAYIGLAPGARSSSILVAPA